MITPEYSQPTRKIGRILPGTKVEIEDTHVIIEDGIGKDAEVTFVGPKTIATIGSHIKRGASVTVESPYASIGVHGSLMRDSSFAMNGGKLDVSGSLRRGVELLTDGEYSIGGRISRMASIGLRNSVEVVEDAGVIGAIEKTRLVEGEMSPGLPPEAEPFFSKDGPGYLPDGVAELFLGERFRNL